MSAYFSLHVAVIPMLMVFISLPLLHAFAQTTNAAELYRNKSLTLPPNVRHLIILIPNEAHESLNQPRDQYPLANQPYLPQYAVVNVGTMIVWFNGDVDHDHKVTLTSEESPDNILFDSGDFAFGEASRPIVLNDTGRYNYYEANVNENDEDFVMRGNITVISEANLSPASPTTTTLNSSSPMNNADTAGVLMLPTQDISDHAGSLKSKGFAVDSMHNFKDLRGGQSGTGDQQTYLVWATSRMDLNEIISTLQELTSDLPYS
jgi:plastocyanin